MRYTAALITPMGSGTGLLLTCPHLVTINAMYLALVIAEHAPGDEDRHVLEDDRVGHVRAQHAEQRVHGQRAPGERQRPHRRWRVAGKRGSGDGEFESWKGQ